MPQITFEPYAIPNGQRLDDALTLHPRSWINPALAGTFELDPAGPCQSLTPLGTAWPEHTRISQQLPVTQGTCVTLPLLWGREVRTAQFSLDGGTLAVRTTPHERPLNLLAHPKARTALRAALDRTARVLRRRAQRQDLTVADPGVPDWDAQLSPVIQELTALPFGATIQYDAPNPGAPRRLTAAQLAELNFHLGVQFTVALTELVSQLLSSDERYGRQVSLVGWVDAMKLAGQLAQPLRPSALLSDATLCTGFPELRDQDRPLRFIRRGILQRRAFDRRDARGLTTFMRAQLPSGAKERRQTSAELRLAVKLHGTHAVEASLRQAELAGQEAGHLETDALTVALERHLSGGKLPAQHVPKARHLVRTAQDLHTIALELARAPHLCVTNANFTVPSDWCGFFQTELTLVRLKNDVNRATRTLFRRHLQDVLLERGLPSADGPFTVFAALPDHWSALIRVNGELFRFQPAASSTDLTDASAALGHCVGFGGYTHGAQSGQQPIIRVFSGQEERFTVELDRRSMTVLQASGSRNRRLTGPEGRALNTWLTLARQPQGPRSGLITQAQRTAALSQLEPATADALAQAHAEAHQRVAAELNLSDADLECIRQLRRNLLAVSRAAQGLIAAASRCWDAMVPGVDLREYGHPVPGGLPLYRGVAQGVATLFDSPYGPSLGAHVTYRQVRMRSSGTLYRVSSHTRVQGRLGRFIISEVGRQGYAVSAGPGCPGTHQLLTALLGENDDRKPVLLGSLRPAKLTTGLGTAADRKRRADLTAAWTQRKAELGLTVDPDGVLRTGTTRLQVTAQWMTERPYAPYQAEAQHFTVSAQLGDLTQALLSQPLLEELPELTAVKAEEPVEFLWAQ